MRIARWFIYGLPAALLIVSAWSPLVGAARAEGVVQRVVSKGQLVLGAVPDAPPMMSTNANGEAEGFAVEVARILQADLKQALGKPVKLRPVMGSLGHAVVFSVASTPDGYAHMHPTLEGGEYAADPTLAFRLRLPAPGSYDLWLQVDDGSRQLLRTSLQVTP